MAIIKDIMREHRGEWLAIEVTKRTEKGPEEGFLLETAVSRNEIFEKVPPSKDREILIQFSGPPLKKGYVALFWCSQ